MQGAWLCLADSLSKHNAHLAGRFLHIALSSTLRHSMSPCPKPEPCGNGSSSPVFFEYTSQVPKSCPNVDAKMLMPNKTWSNQAHRRLRVDRPLLLLIMLLTVTEVMVMLRIKMLTTTATTVVAAASLPLPHCSYCHCYCSCFCSSSSSHASSSYTTSYLYFALATPLHCKHPAWAAWRLLGGSRPTCSKLIMAAIADIVLM